MYMYTYSHVPCYLINSPVSRILNMMIYKQALNTNIILVNQYSCTSYLRVYAYLFQHCDSHGVSKPNRCTVNDNSVIRQFSLSLLLLPLTLSLSLLLWTRRLGETRYRGCITSTVIKLPVACATVDYRADKRGGAWTLTKLFFVGFQG